MEDKPAPFDNVLQNLCSLMFEKIRNTSRVQFSKYLHFRLVQLILLTSTKFKINKSVL